MRRKILFATPEFDDFVRVGGLGAVSAALPRSLRDSFDIRIVMPGYRQVLARASHVESVGSCSPLGGLPACDIGRVSTSDGMPVYVVLCPELYDRVGTPYGDDNGREWEDSDVRFGRLSAAAAEIAAGLVDPNWSADLVHANDWPTALVSAYLHWRGKSLPTILTIHNLAYQGLFSLDTLKRIGAPQASFQRDGIEFHGKVSFLKGGLVHATHLTTVSETYAREITTPEFGCGLDGLLRIRAERHELSGILNGIDESWDPRTSLGLARPFEAGDWEGKRANADAVRRRFGLAISRGPLFGLVARLVHQKGVDLVLSAADAIVAAGGQLVVNGDGEGQIESALKDLQKQYPEAVGVGIGFDEGEARRIYAGSDFTLMPSRYEPCGLSQMYAQRFGSLPIGRETGGLAETIDDGRTGLLFQQPSVEALLGAICRAFSIFDSKSQLNAMRHSAMARIFSWKNSARSYGDLYQRTI